MATLAALTVSACAPTPDPADLVLLGGSVVTLSEAGVAEGIAIRGDRIVAVGSSSEVRAYVGPETRVVELDGRSVIPGLADNHFHGIGGGPGVSRSNKDAFYLCALRDFPGQGVFSTPISDDQHIHRA